MRLTPDASRCPTSPVDVCIVLVGGLTVVALDRRPVLDVVAFHGVEVELVLEDVRVVFFLLEGHNFRLEVRPRLASALTTTHIEIAV